MKTLILISRFAEKQLDQVPNYIRNKLLAWIKSVEELGLENFRKIPGYHDEPLKGNRMNQRSIRLNQAYRAIYEIKKDGSIQLINILEVSKHDY